jgi:hypothetical protein
MSPRSTRAASSTSTPATAPAPSTTATSCGPASADPRLPLSHTGAAHYSAGRAAGRPQAPYSYN